MEISVSPHGLARFSYLRIQARGLVAVKPAPRLNENQGTVPLRDDIEGACEV